MTNSFTKILQFLGLTFLFSGIVVFISLVFNPVGMWTWISPILYSASPALAVVVLKRYIYKEDMASYGLSFRDTNPGWLFQVIGWYVVYILLCIFIWYIGGSILHLAGWGHMELESIQALQSNIEQFIARKEIPIIPLSPIVMVPIFVGIGLLSGYSFKLPILVGEELGWRGFMMRSLQSFGLLQSAILIGVLEGIWQIPLFILQQSKVQIGDLLVFLMYNIVLCYLLLIIRMKSNSLVSGAALRGMFVGWYLFFTAYNIDGKSYIASGYGVIALIALIVVTTSIAYLNIDVVENYNYMQDEVEE